MTPAIGVYWTVARAIHPAQAFSKAFTSKSHGELPTPLWGRTYLYTGQKDVRSPQPTGAMTKGLQTKCCAWVAPKKIELLYFRRRAFHFFCAYDNGFLQIALN
jgi:hypothetical protein